VPPVGRARDGLRRRRLDETPVSVPVSSVIRPADDRRRGFVRRVLAALDRVHRVANVPALTVDVVPLKSGRRHGLFDGRRILVNRTSPARELALVHEIGHVLDYFAIGAVHGRYASEAGEPVLDEWRHAVEDSRTLRLLRETRAALPPIGSSQGIYIDYLLRPSELFARSYAQWLASVAADDTLIEQLEQLRRAEPAAPQLVQWEPGDFDAIRVAYGRLVEQLAWTL
jgi:hypothetical protein